MKPSITSTSPVRASGGASSQLNVEPLISPPPYSSYLCENEAMVTEPSHQAMFRTPTAPAQPRIPVSGSRRAFRTLEQNSSSTISASWWTITSASRSSSLEASSSSRL